MSVILLIGSHDLATVRQGKRPDRGNTDASLAVHGLMRGEKWVDPVLGGGCHCVIG